MASIRNAAKAIIIRDRRLLTIACRDDAGAYFILPGGGQDYGETLHETLLRECREEIGCDVTIGKLVLVREYRGERHESGDASHAVEFMFACSLIGDVDAALASQMDNCQTGVAWLDIDALDRLRFYPKALACMIARLPGGAPLPVYCGDAAFSRGQDPERTR